MEKTSDEILSQIQSELRSLIERASELDRRLTELLCTEPSELVAEEPAEPVAGPEGFAPIDIMVDDEEVSFVVPNRKEELGAPTGFDIDPEVAVEDSPAPEPETVLEALPELDDPAEKTEDKPAAKVGKKPRLTQASRLAAKSAGRAVPKQSKHEPVMFYAWQTATPASPLSNILSGISLKERSLFINVLFKEDAQKFIDTIAAFNAMGSLSEAENHIRKNFPEWKLDSDIMFRLMMAVRRKLN